MARRVLPSSCALDAAVAARCGLTEEYREGIRALTAPGSTSGRAGARHVVVVPGLGALSYLLRFVRELDRRGHRVSLLDVPGFGRRDGAGCEPSVDAVAESVGRWCATLDGDSGPPVLFGHSTGSQAALLAAVRLQMFGLSPAGVVLAGPTVAPNQRSLPRLLATVPLAYRRDSPAELGVVKEFRLGGPDVLRLLRSAIADRPERTVRQLTVPLLVTAGRQDSFAPAGWLVVLAHAARSRTTRVVRLPGSHNNPFTHAMALATTVEAVVPTSVPRATRREGRAGREGRARREGGGTR